MEKLHPNVNNPDEYDGRNFVGPDERDGVDNYVGVDPMYQTYANEGEKPYPFSSEELDEATRRAGLDPEEEAEVRARQEKGADSDDSEATKEESSPQKSSTTAAKKETAPPPPKAPSSSKTSSR